MRINYEKIWAGIKYEYLVFGSEDFIVYIDKDLDVDWETTREWDESGPIDTNEHHFILNEQARIETIPFEGLNKEKIVHFKRLLGEALARTFEHEYGYARQSLQAAENYIKERSSEVSRYWYLSSSLLTASIFIFSFILGWIFRNILENVFGNHFNEVLMVCSLGSVGALLSIILRIGKESLDSSSGQRLLRLEGISRILAGCLSGLLAMFAFNAGILFPTLVNETNHLWGLGLISFISGISERFVPSLVTKFESLQNKSK